MKLTSIKPQTQLAIGTKVRVGSQRGEVVQCIPCFDQFRNPIIVHKIRFTFKSVRKAGKSIWEPLSKPQVRKVNYSFIEVYDLTTTFSRS